MLRSSLFADPSCTEALASASECSSPTSVFEYEDPDVIGGRYGRVFAPGELFTGTVAYRVHDDGSCQAQASFGTFIHVGDEVSADSLFARVIEHTE